MEAALHLQPKAPAYPAGRAVSEARIAVDDGYIWPIDRAQMVTPAAIRERMVEDIGREVRERTEDAVVTLDNLRRLGWTLPQIEAHASRAFAIYKAEAKVAGARGAQVRRDSVSRMAGEAAAIVFFLGSLGIWAGHFTGAL